MRVPERCWMSRDNDGRNSDRGGSADRSSKLSPNRRQQVHCSNRSCLQRSQHQSYPPTDKPADKPDPTHRVAVLQKAMKALMEEFAADKAEAVAKTDHKSDASSVWGQNSKAFRACCVFQCCKLETC